MQSHDFKQAFVSARNHGMSWQLVQCPPPVYTGPDTEESTSDPHRTVSPLTERFGFRLIREKYIYAIGKKKKEIWDLQHAWSWSSPFMKN